MNDQERLLTIFLRLQAGAHLSKRQLSDEFEVSQKTIQRDFALLGQFLEQQPMIAAELAYDHKHHTRYFKGKSLFNKKDILVISKILLENRALNKEENEALLDGLLSLVSKEEQKDISAIIGSERLHYTPLFDTQDRIDKIWEWSEAIRKELVLEIDYQSPYSSRKNLIIFPVSLYYDAHYFYSVAYNLKYKSYITLRLDRIIKWKSSQAKKPGISYGRKFRDGEIRSKHVDAFMGKEITIKVKFRYDPAIIIDQFPTAKILETDSDGTVFEFQSQKTPGLMRWFLSQAESLTILSPQSLIDEMRVLLAKMQKNYRN
ncbi:helix-turn-helix transcriptional regulator [Streptococcus pantholopis]|uniref:Transcriptional regulator n=1 Tax=Streptococcus pantholopis TaxID=1811193 RepID=A0A172Q705_9STRE|nr:WYL domain-containing protein [Streptococcus pantholopis]AND79230.1 transcriptional regulator [Streptococcus pantholopis]